MKHQSYFYFLVLTASLSGCQSIDTEFEIHQNYDQHSESVTIYRSPEEILSIAENAPNKFFKDESSRSAKTRQINTERNVIEITTTMGRSSNPIMYAVNYENNLGFALVSANRNAPEVIAIIEEGNYDDVVAANIPGFNIFMKDATNYLNGIGDFDIIEPGGEKTVYETQILDTYGPNVSNSWYSIENYYDSDDWGGTANLALIQYFQYFRFMDQCSIDLTYTPDNTDFVDFDWDKFDYHFTTHNNDGGYITFDNCDTAFPNQSLHKNMAQLVRELGHRAGTDYSTDYPVTTIDGFLECLDSFGITRVYNKYVREKSCFNAVPLYYMLFMYGVDSNYGLQFWLCDGFQVTRRVGKRYITKDKGLTWEWDGETILYSEMEYYNHLNWCTQAGNGYYLDMEFSPRRSPLTYTSEINYLAIEPYCWYVGL